MFGIYFSDLKRIGHCGFVEVVRGEWIQTIEANTGPEGSREGIFIIYDLGKQQFVSFVYSALRADRQVLLQLPVSFAGDAVHCYMFYTSETGDRVSTSQYLGEMVVV